MIVYAFILIGIGSVKTPIQLVTALVGFGIAGNLVNISVNSQAVGVEHLYKKSIMASFHGFWSLAGFAGAALGAAMIGFEISPTLHFGVVFLIVLMAGLLCKDKLLPNPPQPTDTSSNGSFLIWPDKSLFNLGLIAFFSMTCEGAMFDWSGVYFKNVIQAESALIAAGYLAFMCTMASGRFIADRLVALYGTKRILQMSGVLIVSGLLISVTFPRLLPGIVGFFLVGAGVSAVVPLIYGAAGRSKTLPPSFALSIVSTIGFSGFLIGPPLIGWIAGVSSLRISFTIIAIMGLAIALKADSVEL